MADESTTPQAQVGSTGPAAPAPIAIAEDSLFTPPGASGPVTWKDFISGYVPKSDYTKGRQEFARERDTHARSVQEWETRRQQAEALLLEQARTLASQRGGNGADQDPLIAKLRGLTYLDGESAASIVETLRTQGIAPLVQAIQQRDKALGLMYQRLQKLEHAWGQMESQTFESGAEAFIRQTRANLDLPDDAETLEWMRDIYAAYEGKDRDEEYPSIVKRRWDALGRLHQAAQRAAADKAKQSLIPGKGGAAAPSKPLTDRLSKLDADSLASELWKMFPRDGQDDT